LKKFYEKGYRNAFYFIISNVELLYLYPNTDDMEGMMEMMAFQGLRLKTKQELGKQNFH